MANFPIQPTRSASGVIITGQTLTVTGTTQSFAAFSGLTSIVAIQVRGNDAYCTFDGTTPSGSSGFQMYSTKAYHWGVDAARSAKFAQVSATSTIYCQECQIKFGDTDLPDMSLVKSSAAP